MLQTFNRKAMKWQYQDYVDKWFVSEVFVVWQVTKVALLTFLVQDRNYFQVQESFHVFQRSNFEGSVRLKR